jgi:hypothetical protein
MQEITALMCNADFCLHTWIVRTPASELALRELVQKNSRCPECGHDSVLQIDYKYGISKPMKYCKIDQNRE